ncbi:MAG TPA: PQQ-binding-like beta-propeller repeat protein [Vicinamibacterales bacterium]|nr:PQQ-binding-like beta-propeller repeat protein [Vicinamibacterales bacterium]
MIAKRLFVAVVCALSVSPVTRGQSSAPATTDWPQWRGPERTGISAETGLLQQWPAGGPPVAWSITGVGAGYGTAVVQGQRIFVQGMRGRESMVHALNLADGKYIWSKNLGSAGSNDRGSGPRSTPTIDGDRLYILTEQGELWCLKQDGAEVWHRNILSDFHGSNITWLLSESPLVDGDKVIVTPGGRGAGLVALEKMTGKTIWTTKELSDDAGYASAMVVDVQGIRAYTTFTASAAVGVRASDGKLMWRYPRAANGTANITTPVVFQNKVFYASDYGTGGGLVALRAQNGELAADEVYFTRDMQNHHGGVVLVNGTLYGFNNAILTAIDFASGKTLWRDRSVGKGSVTFADNRLYMLSENNVVGLAEVTPQGYREVGRFEIADQGLPSWSHPVVSGGRMYLRNQNVLTVYDVRARQ